MTQVEISDHRSESGREAAVELCPCGTGGGPEQPGTRSVKKQQDHRRLLIQVRLKNEVNGTECD